MAVDPQTAGRDVHRADDAASPEERLDRFLRTRLESLASRLPPDGTPLDERVANEVAALESLSNLKREHLRVEAPQRRSLVPLALVIATAGVITCLVFIPLPLIQVEMDLVCSAVTFRTQGAVQLTGLSSLKLLQGVAFAPAQVEEPVNLRTLELRAPMELRPKDEGSLTLSSITIPARTVVSIEKTADEGTWRLQIASPDAKVAATLAGSVDVSSPGSASQTIDFGHGAKVALDASPPTSMLEIHVTPGDAESFLVRRTIPLTEVSFEETIEEPTPENVGVIRGRASSVLEGKIFNESLGGQQSSLRNREQVSVSVVDGQIRELRLDKAALHVNLSASAREVRIGSSGGSRSLRPSYLEWLAEYHTLQLAWGSAAWLFALVLGGVKWWQQ